MGIMKWVLAGLLFPLLAMAVQPPQIGYIPLHDGTRLAYILYKPAAAGRFPVLVKYEPYWGGGTQFKVEEPLYLQHAYAVMMVNVRGTGCSSGQFHRIREPIQVQDGAEVIEWAGTQLWSDGNVGMFGNSYSGITQLMVGPLRPKHLKVLAMGGIVSDG